MELSVIIPFFNEETNIDYVLGELEEVLSAAGIDFELIAVDDGSTDATLERLQQLASTQPFLQVIDLKRHAGKDAALLKGFALARGRNLATIDGDGQDDPQDILKMIPLLEQVDAVFGSRIKREDSWAKRKASGFAYGCRVLLLGDDVRDTACGLKVFRRDVLTYLLPFKGMHRFIPFLLKQAGCTYETMEVNHRRRYSGKAKFTLRSLYFLPTISDILAMSWFKKRCLFRYHNPRGKHE